MKHNLRINGEVKEFDCELGSGIRDKNGREIFEGDIVDFMGVFTSVVEIDRYGQFFIKDGDNNKFLVYMFQAGLEVIGHVAEDDKN